MHLQCGAFLFLRLTFPSIALWTCKASGRLRVNAQPRAMHRNRHATRCRKIAVDGPWREASLPRAPVLMHPTPSNLLPYASTLDCCNGLGHGSREKLGRHKRNHGVLSLVSSRTLVLNVPNQPNTADCTLSAVHTRANQTKARARATGPTGWPSAYLSLKQ